MPLSGSSNHSWKIVVNNVYRSWVALVSSAFLNAIKHFIFKKFSWESNLFQLKEYLRMTDLGTSIT